MRQGEAAVSVTKLSLITHIGEDQYEKEASLTHSASLEVTRFFDGHIYINSESKVAVQ